ncbi:hypothetical protein L7F22_058721 [Adiantum nelumboides]|nr:hypothetical protein [Adiantum nelumboides]
MAANEAPIVRDNWSMDDFKTLANAKLRLDNEMTVARGKQKIVSLDERWTQVAKWVKDDGVTRTPLQCCDKWEIHFPNYCKIQNCEKFIPSGLSSFWQMDPQERQSHGLPKSFDKTMFGILDSRFGADVLGDPGDIIVDSSMNAVGMLIVNFCAGTSVHSPSFCASINIVLRILKQGQSNYTPFISPSHAYMSRRVPSKHASVVVAHMPHSSRGKKRRGKESRVSGLKRDFQDINKNLIDLMEKSVAKRAKTQEKHVEGTLAV